MNSPLEQDFQNQFISALKKDFSPHLKKSLWSRVAALNLPQSGAFGYKNFPSEEFYSLRFPPQSHLEPSLQDIQPGILEECKNSYLTFVNGVFSPHLSARKKLLKGLKIETPKKAPESNFEESFLTLLSQACTPKATVITLSQNTELSPPLQLLFVYTNTANLLTAPRLIIQGEKNCQATFVLSFLPLANQVIWNNAFYDLRLEEGAKLEFTEINSSISPFWNFSHLSAKIAAAANLDLFNFSHPNKFSKHDYSILLNGKEAALNLSDLSLLDKQALKNINIFVRHAHPHSHSKQLLKTILSDAARLSFTGKIQIDRLAEEARAHQQTKCLLLSDNAKVHSLPTLEILNDNVKVSHGLAIGQFDEEELFYLLTKGIPPREAKQMLLHGFCKDFLNVKNSKYLEKSFQHSLTQLEL